MQNKIYERKKLSSGNYYTDGWNSYQKYLVTSKELKAYYGIYKLRISAHSYIRKNSYS